MTTTLELLEKEFFIFFLYLVREKISYTLIHNPMGKLIDAKEEDLLNIKKKLEELTGCVTADFFDTSSSILERNDPVHVCEFNYNDVTGNVHFSNTVAKNIINKIEEAVKCQGN